MKKEITWPRAWVLMTLISCITILTMTVVVVLRPTIFEFKISMDDNTLAAVKSVNYTALSNYKYYNWQDESSHNYVLVIGKVNASSEMVKVAWDMNTSILKLDSSCRLVDSMTYNCSGVRG